jgi:hypothetical protein
MRVWGVCVCGGGGGELGPPPTLPTSTHRIQPPSLSPGQQLVRPSVHTKPAPSPHTTSIPPPRLHAPTPTLCRSQYFQLEGVPMPGTLAIDRTAGLALLACAAHAYVCEGDPVSAEEGATGRYYGCRSTGDMPEVRAPVCWARWAYSHSSAY